MLAFLPARSNFNRSHIFVQDEIALRPDLDLTLGLKLDRNTYTGWNRCERPARLAPVQRASVLDRAVARGT